MIFAAVFLSSCEAAKPQECYADAASLKKNALKHYVKNHSFADLSTRKHYPGTHSIVLIINGAQRRALDFELSESYPYERLTTSTTE